LNNKGYITRADFTNTVVLAYQVLDQMGLQHPALIANEQLLKVSPNQVKSSSYIDQLFDRFDLDRNQAITKKDFIQIVAQNQDINDSNFAFGALGLLDDLKSNIRPKIPLKKNGLPVSFGHSSFQKVLSMMIGIRLGVSYIIFKI
jgi:hypothetical protein